jgi:hypothetical protein
VMVEEVQMMPSRAAVCNGIVGSLASVRARAVPSRRQR